MKFGNPKEISTEDIVKLHGRLSMYRIRRNREDNSIENSIQWYPLFEHSAP